MAQTEIWQHLDGDPLALHVIEGGGHVRHVLDRTQQVVPANAWQAAEPIGANYTLCACVVAPGFDLEDFEMPPRKVLLGELPHLSHLVTRLTRG